MTGETTRPGSGEGFDEPTDARAVDLDDDPDDDEVSPASPVEEDEGPRLDDAPAPVDENMSPASPDEEDEAPPPPPPLDDAPPASPVEEDLSAASPVDEDEAPPPPPPLDEAVPPPPVAVDVATAPAPAGSVLDEGLLASPVDDEVSPGSPVDEDEAPPPPPPLAGEMAPDVEPGRRRRAMLVRFGFPIALVVLAALTFVFTLMGRDAILDSTEGNVIEPVTDPNQPGYRVLVEPTPSALWLLVHDDELVGAVVAGLGDPEGGGGVLVLPAELTTEGLAGRTLADAFLLEGAEGVQAALGNAVGVGFADTAVIDDFRWETLTGTVAPLQVTVVDELVTETGEVLFGAGDLEVDAGDVGDLVAYSSPDEPPNARLVRQANVFDAYLDAIAEAGPDAVPGEGDVGVSGFLRAMAGGSHVVVAPETSVADGALITDERALSDLVIDLVPFPLPAEAGARPTVRLLDGVGDQGAALDVAEDLVRAGAQVSILGNAVSFDVAETTIAHHTEAARDAAEAFREALGFGDVVFEPLTADRQTSFIDITVTVGADAEMTDR